MSVDIEKIKGFTITLKENLTHEDFEFFENVEEKHKEFAYRGKYSQFGMKPNQVALVVDGMNGNYARLVYVEKTAEVYDVDYDETYIPLKQKEMTEDIYNEMNECYKMIYGKDLDKEKIEYALWYHFS
jgi:hypothetical protein